MRSRDLSEPETSTITYEDLVEGENVDAVVKKVELYGLFVEIKGTKISGLCHKSEVGHLLRAWVIASHKPEFC